MSPRWMIFAGLLAACAPEVPPPAAPRPVAPAPAPAPAPIAAAVPAAPEPACPALEVTVPALEQTPQDPPVPDVARAETLSHFFEKVARLLRGQASDHIRIAVYGDSNLTMDFMTGRMRRVLQGRHGDAGHGFVALGKPWSHYLHMDVRHGVKTGIASYACSTTPVMDGIYGISGIAAESLYAGAKTWVETALATAPIGQRVSDVDIYYLKHPRGGSFDVYVDDAKHHSVATRADALGLGVDHLDVDDGPHRFEIEVTDQRRRVRLLGLTLERDVAPSFIVDSFGVGAMNTASQARQHMGINEEMLRHRRYDLIIFATGANDVFTLDVTPGHLRKLIALQRQALPEASILLMTPSDRGKERTFAPTWQAVKQRRQIAADDGLALWDLWQAMGAPHAMFRFKLRGLSQPDYIHFTEAGGAWAADRLLHALWRALAQYVEAHPQAGCDGGHTSGSGVAQRSSPSSPE